MTHLQEALWLRAGSARTVNRRYIAIFVAYKDRTWASALFVSLSAVGMALGPLLALPLSHFPTLKFAGLTFDHVRSPPAPSSNMAGKEDREYGTWMSLVALHSQQRCPCSIVTVKGGLAVVLVAEFCSSRAFVSAKAPGAYKGWMCCRSRWEAGS